MSKTPDSGIILDHRFYIDVVGRSDIPSIRATEVKGLSMQINYQKIVSTSGPVLIPSDWSYGELVIKRALFEKPGSIDNFIEKALNARQISPLNFGIHLLSSSGEYVRSWVVGHALATDWELEGMTASGKGIMIEKMTFNYKHIRVVK